MMLNIWCFSTLGPSLNILTKNDQTDKVFFWPQQALTTSITRKSSNEKFSSTLAKCQHYLAQLL